MEQVLIRLTLVPSSNSLSILYVCWLGLHIIVSISCVSNNSLTLTFVASSNTNNVPLVKSNSTTPSR